jgi:hypothetical protein
MKIVFQAPARLRELPAEAYGAEATPAGAFLFAPLAVGRRWEDRIDVSVRPPSRPRTYPFKRADESVN